MKMLPFWRMLIGAIDAEARQHRAEAAEVKAGVVCEALHAALRCSRAPAVIEE